MSVEWVVVPMAVVLGLVMAWLDQTWMGRR